MAKVLVSKEAAEELVAAAERYDGKLPGLGSRLIDAFERALQLLREPNPPLTHVAGSAARLGARKLVLHKFPFSLITVEADQTIIVVALAHHKRMPGYWMREAPPDSTDSTTHEQPAAYRAHAGKTLSVEAKKAYFAKTRVSNYAASLRLEGVAVPSDVTPARLEQQLRQLIEEGLADIEASRVVAGTEVMQQVRARIAATDGEEN